MLLALALLAGGLAGMQKLQPEDRLLERFGQSTELFQGMREIDREFGGADTLAIVLESDTPRQAGAGSANPWYSARGLQRLQQVHDYLDALEESASVRSLALFGATAAELLDGPADDQQLAAAWRGMPAARRALLLDPYLSAATARTLIVIGLNGTGPALPRHELIERIRAQLTGELGFAPEQVRIGGLAVLQGNALRTLLRTQLIAVAAACVVLALLVLAPVPFAAAGAARAGAEPVHGRGGQRCDGLARRAARHGVGRVRGAGGGELCRRHPASTCGASGPNCGRAPTGRPRCSAAARVRRRCCATFRWASARRSVLLAAADFRPSAHFGLLCALALTAASGFVALLLPPLLRWSGLPACRRPPTVDDDFHPADA